MGGERRRPLSLGAAALGALLLLGAAPAVVIDGKPLPAAALADVHDKTYVALRAVGDALGAQVRFDGRTKRATVTTEFREVVFTLDKPFALVNGELRAIDAAPAMVDGRVLIPLRALAQALGASIRYDADSHAVLVSTAGTIGAPSTSGTAPSVPSTNTLQGTVTDVEASSIPPAVGVDVDHLSYTITVPDGTMIQFRDTHGGSTGRGPLSAVRPGDTLIATLDSGGHLISIADIFTGFGGTVASASSTNMVLTNGRVVESGPQTSVLLDGHAGTFSDLRAGDLVTVRADPRTGKVRDVLALTPGGAATSATATPSAGAGTGDVKIAAVSDDADHALRTGQTLHVRMDGTPAGTATFDLSNVIVDNAMKETRPGHYEGSYVVEVGTNLVDAPIIVHLAKGGLTALAVGPDALAIITTPPTVKDAKPDADSQVNNPRPNIYATFSSFGDRGISAQSLKLVVNGKDVSAQATRTADFVSYLPPSDFPGGRVTVEVSGVDTAGNPFYYKWSFSVVR